MENNINPIIYTLSAVIQIITFLFVIHYFIISVWGWIKRKEEDSSNFPPQKRFALVVAAHNEEKVIRQIIDSLKKLNYPKDLYDIFIVADNCTDNTAEIARQEGVYVYERFNTVKRGKGYALEWIFDKIFKLDKQYDVISVFDADNVVSSNFLMEMNKQFCKGYKVVQGYIDSKNPYDSWITSSYAITYWIMNRFFQLARYYCGLTCALGGTGFSVDTEILKKFGWGATCLTEDLEFTMKLALNDLKVAWCHDAVVYDEKPLTLKQSWTQRKRWMQGHTDCAIRFIPKLLKKAIKEKNIIAFDCVIYLLQPINLVFMGLLTIMAYTQWLFPKGTFFGMDSLVPYHIWTILMIAQLLYGPLIVASERKFNIKTLIGFLVYPIFTFTWVPITIQGFLERNNKEWTHTLHTRQISINELEQA